MTATKVDFAYPYVCSLTPICRAAVNFLNSKNKIQEMVEGVLIDLNEREGVAASLKVPINGCCLARQIDIRPSPDSSEIIFKVFVEWRQDWKCWYVFVEGGMESYWENQFGIKKDNN